MATQVVIDLKANGAQQVADALNQAAARAKALAFAIDDTTAAAKAARKAADDFDAVMIKAGAASKWSPAIGAAHRAKSAVVGATQATQTLNTAGQRAGTTLSGGFNKAANSASHLVSRLNNVSSAINDIRSKQESLDALGSTAKGVAMAGAAGVAGAGAAGVAAGEYNRIRDSFRNALGKDAGDEFLHTLESSDVAKVFGLKNMLEQAQFSLAQGFKPDEIINKQGNGLYQLLGDAAARSGADPEGMKRALTQLAQIRSRGKTEAEDLNTIAEGGKLPIIPIFQEVFGKERVAQAQSGDKAFTYEEVAKGLREGIPKFNGGMFQGGMAASAEGAPGKIQEARNSIYLLVADLGQVLVPALTMAAQAVTTFSNFIRALPGPFKAVLVVGGVLTAALVGLGGVVVTLAVMAGTTMLALQGLGFSLGAATIATGGATIGANTLATTLTTRLVPAMLAASRAAMAMPFAKAGIVGALGVGLGVGGYEAIRHASGDSDDDGELDMPSAGEAASNAWGRFKAFVTTGRSSNYDKEVNRQWAAERAEKASLDAANAKREKEGLAALSVEDFRKGIRPANDSAMREMNQQLKSLQTSFTANSSPIAMPSLGDATATFSGDIDSMRRQKMLLKGKENQGARDALGLQIFDATVAAKHERAAEAASKKEEAALRKAGRIKEANEKKAQRERDKAIRAAASQERKEEAQLHREKMQNLRAHLNAEVAAKRMTRAEATAALNAEENAFDRSRLSMGGGALGNAAGQGGISQGEMNLRRELPFAQQMLRGMPKRDAELYMARMNAGFATNESMGGINGIRAFMTGQGTGQVEGFGNEAQADAFKRAFAQRYGGVSNIVDSYRGYSGAQAASGGALGGLGGDGASGGLYGNTTAEVESVREVAPGVVDIYFKAARVELKNQGRGRQLFS